MCVRKVRHWALPIVWAPERAVMSRAVSPFLPKLVIRVVRFDLGLGRSRLASLWLAVLASLRPRANLHDGPPNYMQKSRIRDDGNWNPIQYIHSTYLSDSKTSCKSKNVSTRHSSRTWSFNVSFNLINDFKPSSWVPIRKCVFLSCEARCVVQKNRTIATLELNSFNLINN